MIPQNLDLCSAGATFEAITEFDREVIFEDTEAVL